ncbi:ABC transporter permease [Arthrobacter russicus]|uniref:NitT/TauT family transport system permease protein n=1 Tax=Arthrobacter russicus TaxID=172040 RepID=A0ABU1JD74_9MICC|nr:ABC transporter permease subunit [Arthrobacter russicus]MDN5669169.1 ABC transporter permease subunit [Renibacterium salmoninarum]MDR6270345.1 NitT/TauT family transport system permease protein [Arthrobacter russicus]
MSSQRSFPGTGTLRRPVLRWIDLVVGGGLVVLLFGVIRLAPDLNVPFDVGSAPAEVSTDPEMLPYYALRSLLRMFIALACSLLFTFVFATAAARLPRARKVLLPILDILQSVPILGFLSVTVTAFIALFPNSLLGLEMASIFAIFTSQAWNMAFSFYYALVSQPKELDEAARLMRLTKWQRFWKLDVPAGMIPLVWNGMMSFGGGWFFLAASEAITVNNQSYALPGVGAYVASAVEKGELGNVGWAILAMAIMVIGVNFLFWRPLVAWAEKFRQEETPAADKPRSVVLDLLRRSSIPYGFGRALKPVARGLEVAARPFGIAEHPLRVPVLRRRVGDVLLWVLVGAAIGYGAWQAALFIQAGPGFGTFAEAAGLGAVTMIRVAVVMVLATLIWVPIGVWIGMNPKVSRLAQPVVQLLASFPANFLFPFVIAFFVASGISLDYGGVLLMALGAQWYILFNVIAGASAIPTDLNQAMQSFGVSGWQRWRRLILPAVFPAYVTGAITAAGGAWNASIVSEIVTYNQQTLTATGLGSYIAQATASGDMARVLVGVILMSVFVVGLNRLVWRRLYALAESRYAL